MARDDDYHCHHNVLDRFQHLPGEEIAVGGGADSSHPHHGPIYHHYPSMGFGTQEQCGGCIHRVQQFGQLDELWDSNHGWALDHNHRNDWVRLPGPYV